jgi:hypothetical protein
MIVVRGLAHAPRFPRLWFFAWDALPLWRPDHHPGSGGKLVDRQGKTRHQGEMRQHKSFAKSMMTHDSMFTVDPKLTPYI